MDIKTNLASNIVSHRKALNLTQAELAKEINYSDKAVSKWERGEAVPEITVLKQLADFFGVTIDKLLQEPSIERPKPIRNLDKRRIYIGLWSLSIVWLVAILCYFFIDIFLPWFEHTWLFFIYSLPISFLVVFILTSVWNKKLTNLILQSLFVWTLILSVYLSLLVGLNNPPAKLWKVFLIGIPLEALLVFLFLYKRCK